MYYTDERNLGFTSQGTHRSGARVYNNTPGTLRDKYILGDEPHLRHKQGQENAGQNAQNQEERVRAIISSFENVNEFYVFTHNGIMLIGIESSEQNRPKLIVEVEEAISDVVDLKNVRIATDRQNVNKIRNYLGARHLDR